eukprot:7931094-Ditylum_brightwellii.AAC.1
MESMKINTADILPLLQDTTICNNNRNCGECGGYGDHRGQENAETRTGSAIPSDCITVGHME